MAEKPDTTNLSAQPGAKAHRTRRAALALFAGASALAIFPVAALAPHDPVFGAIARHKVAWAAFVETCDPLDNVEGEQEGTKEEAAYRDASVTADEALEEFLATTPTTLAGLHAALEYVVEVDGGCLPDNGGVIAATLLKSPVFAGMRAEGLAHV